MNDNLVKDDIAFYFMWKSKIEKNELPIKNQGSDNVRRLSRRLSMAVSKPKTEFPEIEKPIKIPVNKEIALINKWKAVDKAQDDLEIVRNRYEERIEQFESRWREVEKGQLRLKQSLVKFNNFVKEKQIKIAEGAKRSINEHNIFSKKYEELQHLEGERDILKKAKECLTKTMKEREVFKNYLELVIENNTGIFASVPELMKRCESLIASREKLKCQLSLINGNVAKESADLEKFKEDKMALLLDYNVSLADLQHTYSQNYVKTMEKKRYVDNIEEKKVEKG